MCFFRHFKIFKEEIYINWQCYIEQISGREKCSSEYQCMCVCRMAQFLVSLLPTSSSQSEKSVIINTDASPDLFRASPATSSGISGSDMFDVSASSVVFRIRLRNVLLHVILRLTTNVPSMSSSPHTGSVISSQSVSLLSVL